MKNRSKQTLQQRFGFADEDLKTSEHDQIMFWLDKRALEFAKSLIEWQDTWPQSTISQQISSLDRGLTKRRNDLQKYVADRKGMCDSGNIPLWCKAEAEKATQELEFLNRYKTLGEPPPPRMRVQKTWEAPITQAGYNTKHIVGFVDMLVHIYTCKLRACPEHF